jgi:hypothetical protein
MSYHDERNSAMSMAMVNGINLTRLDLSIEKIKNCCGLNFLSYNIVTRDGTRILNLPTGDVEIQGGIYT